MAVGRKRSQKTFKKDTKRATIELWRASVPLSTIKQQEDILKVWLLRTQECTFLQSLVASMPGRMQEVIDREGAMTKYSCSVV